MTVKRSSPHTGVKDAAWYFDSAKWHWKLLRALNLLEPDRTVLSFSKVYAWLSVLAFLATLLVYLGTLDAKAMIALAATGANNIVALGNYELRRRAQMRGRGNGDEK